MTNEEKILALLAEMNAEIKSLKAEVNALRPHVESKEEVEARYRRLTKFLLDSLNEELTPEEIAEGEELARNYYASKSRYRDDEKNSADAIIDAGRRVAS